MPHRRSAKLARWQFHMLGWSGGGLWLSGVGWLLLHHFGQREGAFGPEMNPLEPWMMAVHGLVLIPALLGLGGLLVVHIPKGWKKPRQRTTGMMLCALLAALIISGYMLYYVGNEDVRALTSLGHWGIGVVLPAPFLWHMLQGMAVRQRRRAGSARPARERPPRG